jgi:hypothetical protein
MSAKPRQRWLLNPVGSAIPGCTASRMGARKPATRTCALPSFPLTGPSPARQTKLLSLCWATGLQWFPAQQRLRRTCITIAPSRCCTPRLHCGPGLLVVHAVPDTLLGVYFFPPRRWGAVHVCHRPAHVPVTDACVSQPRFCKPKSISAQNWCKILELNNNAPVRTSTSSLTALPVDEETKAHAAYVPARSFQLPIVKRQTQVFKSKRFVGFSHRGLQSTDFFFSEATILNESTRRITASQIKSDWFNCGSAYSDIMSQRRD